MRLFDTDKPVGKRSDFSEAPAHHGLDESEVFADDESLRATALVGQERQQDVSRVVHVRAVRSRHPLGIQNSRNRPMTWSRRMSDAALEDLTGESVKGAQYG